MCRPNVDADLKFACLGLLCLPFVAALAAASKLSHHPFFEVT
jgi:hypothetical protein